MQAGISFVTEIEDFDHFLTGRFDAGRDRGGSHEQGPRDASLQDALDWARTRTTQVVVCLGSERYTAGETALPDYPPLPATTELLGRRRDPAFAYLDRQATDPFVDWPVSLSLHLEAQPVGSMADVFVAAIAHHPASQAVQSDPDRTSHTVRASIVVSARTHDAARRIAESILERARATALDNNDGVTSGAWYAGFSVEAPLESPETQT